jgi:glycosyltransferase involved in cell wall biosynthesis
MRPPGSHALASFAIMAFNQEGYIEQAMRAAFSQDYHPLEIIVSDDASTDGTADVIRRVAAGYDGPHSVVVNVNPVNLGIGAHVNHLFRMAKGEVLVLAGGDDTSLPQRTSRVMECWRSVDPKPSAVYCGARKISPEGDDMGSFVSEIATGPRDAEHVILFKNMKRMLAIGACGAYDSGLMRKFGELDDDLPIEDIPLIARACMSNGLSYIDEDLVRYRSNVSVWRPRKLADDTFERRVQRRRFYTLARLKVARQVLSDAIATRDPSFISAALRAYALHDFVHDACARQRFSPKRYLWVAMAAGNWLYPLVAATLDGHPRVHRFLFWLKHALVQPVVLFVRRKPTVSNHGATQ